jgi:hypothetical protein
LIPRVLAFYRSIQASNQRPGAIRPPPPRIKLGLNVIYAFIVISLLQTLPYFSPTNIFRDTNSRLGISTNLLFSRLTTIRGGQLTPIDLALKEKFGNETADFRLLYAAYGPDVVTQCSFCSTADPSAYLIYAIPSILAPHLFHICLLGIITSSFFSGREGARWRTHATIAGVFLAVGEIVLVSKNDWKLNSTRRNLEDVDFFHWRLRVYRLLAFGLADGLLGWAIWLTSTNRWLVKPPSVSDQLIEATQSLQLLHSQMGILGRMRNAILRDDELRTAGMRYWEREPKIMEEVEQQREVVDAKRLALSRMDYDKVQASAGLWVDQIFHALRPPSTSPTSPAQTGREKAD